MTTIITITGVFRHAEDRKYAEFDDGVYTLVLPENLSEDKAVQKIFEVLGDAGVSLVRKRGYVGDRVDVRGGIMSHEPLTYIQPQNAKGQFASYEDIGRELWQKTGAKSRTAQDPVTKQFISFATYARIEKGVMITGKKAKEAKEETETALDALRGEVSSLTWKTPRSGNYWRKTGVKRIESKYKGDYQKELEL